MENIQGKTPIILLIAFALTILSLSAGKLRGWAGEMRFYGLFLVGLYLLWLLVEAVVAISEIKQEKTSCDQGTCEWYAFGRAATVITALVFPTRWTKGGLWMLIGIGLFILGVGIRLWAIHSLGHFYSHRVRLVDSHKIITGGPYSVIRHPAYSGMLLSHMGFITFFLTG